MPCHPIPGGVACSRGTRTRCSAPGCALWSKKLCDYPIDAPGRKSKTCDRPLCERHATSVGRDRDYCPPHARLSEQLFTER